MWRGAALHSKPLAALHHHGRRRKVPSTRACNAMSPAPETELRQQPWCRPLSGCTAARNGSDGQAAGLQPQPAAAELPAIVALGKFDALHKGHRALATAAAQLGGAPWLVSFGGIAQVLGWPARLPLVAPCDRLRVLASWAMYCEGQVPRECTIPFAEVRMMSPEAFVELLAAQLQVAGVVVGSNYRFGYRAAGTAELLQQLGPQYGMQVRVLRLVGSQPGLAAAAAGAAGISGLPAAASEAPGSGHHHLAAHEQQQPQQQQRAADREVAHQAVSSSRVRHALAAGNMADAAECLGRPYRLVASLAEAASSTLPDGAALRLPSSAFLNQPPCPGRYHAEAAVTGGDTLQQLLPPRQALLGVDETGLTLHGAADLLEALPPDAQHLTLDFI